MNLYRAHHWRCRGTEASIFCQPFSRLSLSAAIPEIQAIDQELERLRARTRELMRLRSEVISRHEATLEPFRREMEWAEQDLLDADPVRQVREEVLLGESVASDAAVPQS